MSNIGYVRVSSVQQSTERQLSGVTLDKVFTDSVSGKDTNREGLKECLAYLREGDTLHVHSLDRLSRSTIDTLALIGDLNEKGIAVHLHKEKIIADTNSAMGKLMLTVIAAVAEAERALISERRAEARAINPRPRGYGKNVNRDGIIEALNVGGSIAKVAEKFNVGKSTVQRIKKEIQKHKQ
ncbi:recombinase family protein [Rosenbergiella metrosideri]|uniref:recombinase family protein n=1 Tax=Rosenbergiella metrosideri TaxID=2921185 RepID=UPI001F4F352B|nr:recombinase family protein [Rosenbergiella metrosideri]